MTVARRRCSASACTSCARCPGLVADNADGCRHLPLRIALRIGAPRLLCLSIAATVLVVAGLLVDGTSVGLSQ